MVVFHYSGTETVAIEHVTLRPIGFQLISTKELFYAVRFLPMQTKLG